MRNISYDDLSNRCKEIIRNKSPEDAINLIAKLKIENGLYVGLNTAKKIYKIYGDESVKYNSNDYGENISTYSKKVKNNINKACNNKGSKNNK
jgi:hypothetical protein